jgi:hypothetical protein
MAGKVAVYTKEVWDWVPVVHGGMVYAWDYRPLRVEAVEIDRDGDGKVEEAFKIKDRYQRKVKELVYDKCESKIHYWLCDESVVNEIVTRYAVRE